MPISVFLSFAEKEYQTESKRNETFAMIFLDQKTTRRLGDEFGGATRRPQGRRACLGGSPPPLWAPRDSTDLFLLPIYSHISPNQQRHPRKHFSTATTFCTREIPSRDLFRHPAGGGFDHGGLLHQLYCPSDEV